MTLQTRPRPVYHRRPLRRAGALSILALLISGGCSAPLVAEPMPRVCPEIPQDVYAPGARDVSTHSKEAKAYFRRRLEAFSKEPLGCGQIVMLGDSHTELNDWNAAIPGNLALRNRGIGGDTSEGVLTRLEEITLSQPQAVFLLIGTNDVWTPTTPEMTVAAIAKTVRVIRAKSPETLIFVQTVFPMRTEYGPNDRIRAINTLLKARSQTAKFILLDPYAQLVDKGGKLNAAYTDDGLHLNAAGNAVWSELVTSALRANGLLDDAS